MSSTEIINGAATIDQESDAELAIPGLPETEHARSIIYVLLGNGLRLPTSYLHDPKKGSMQEFRSVTDIQQFLEENSKSKEGKVRIEIMTSHLRRRVTETLDAIANIEM